MKTYDIVVVGGGFAGVGAAISAAREGKSVLLIEQSGSLGGAASNCLVMPFMEYWTYPDGTKERLFLVRGIFEEIMDKLRKAGMAEDTAFNSEFLKILLDRMMNEYGVQVLFHTTVTGAVKVGRQLREVSVATVAGVMNFGAKIFIDATGDANLCALSGCDFMLGRKSDSLCQPMTLCFRLSGVSWDKMLSERDAMQKLYEQYRSDGKIKNPRENILLFKTLDKNVIHFNSTRVVKLNPTDPFELSRAEVEAREQMAELVGFLKENVSAFADAQIVSSASSIGVRESRMVVGEHILTGDELIATLKFDDAVAAGNYDIDIHNPEGSGTSHYYFQRGTYYTIPYRSLVAKDLDNMLVAGRCISCDHEAQASIRIMPICCATGEAAGVGASVAVSDCCAAKYADISKIQSTLKKHGVFF